MRARRFVCPLMIRDRGFVSSAGCLDGFKVELGALRGPPLGFLHVVREETGQPLNPQFQMSGGRLPTAMRALVRRPVGLGNYVPEGACFQTEGEKTCTLSQAAAKVGVELIRRSRCRGVVTSMALGLKRGPVTSRPSLHFRLWS